MPITPAYEWREAETSLSVDIKIRAVTPSSADILMTDCYAKVNCAPFFFEADLYGEIDPRRSSASVGQDTIKFFFIKKEQGLWGRLTLPGDRKMILDRRHRSLAAIREQAHKDREDFPAKLSNIGRLAVGEQMKLEEARRKAIKLKKNDELRAEQEGLKRWMESSGRLSITHTDRQTMSEEPCSEVEEEMPELSSAASWRREDPGLVRECHQLGRRRSNTCDVTGSFTQIRDTSQDITTWLPAPRRSSSIPVTFSSKPDRPMHLPARESRDKVQLKKRETGSADASNPTEREPIFLQDKADKFFRCGDYHSAINAYTSALEADSSLLLYPITPVHPCKLELGQFEASKSDCSKAVRILQHVMPERDLAIFPPGEFLGSGATAVHHAESSIDQISFSSLGLLTCLKAHEVNEDPGGWEARVKKQVLLLQGTAKYHEGNLQQALEDYMQALRFEPKQKELEHIITHLKRLLETNTS